MGLDLGGTRRHTQSARTRAVALEFNASWDAMVADPGWWPGPVQVECARLVREAGGPAAALRTDGYISVLCRSLSLWRAFRGAPVDRERVRACLRGVAPLLDKWGSVTILSVGARDYEGLFGLFDALRDLKPSKRKWVVTSKALHHLLLDLVVPMDNLVTAPFLGRSSLPASFDADFLREAYGAFTDLLRNKDHGIGQRRLRGAARQVPHQIAGASPHDCRIGMARVIDFAIAGVVSRHGRASLRLAHQWHDGQMQASR